QHREKADRSEKSEKSDGKAHKSAGHDGHARSKSAPVEKAAGKTAARAADRGGDKAASARADGKPDGKSDGKSTKARPQGANASRESERKKQQLITMGKAKGYLTYDEVNDHLGDDVVSSDQIDDWLSSLGDEGIEIVDAAASVKLPAAAAAAPPK